MSHYVHFPGEPSVLHLLALVVIAIATTTALAYAGRALARRR